MPVLFLIFALFLPTAVAADSPYLTNEATIEHADWGEISVGVLIGDGIIGPDPKRIVVMDAAPGFCSRPARFRSLLSFSKPVQDRNPLSGITDWTVCCICLNRQPGNAVF